MALYETALQVVPVLMIALFLDPRTAGRTPPHSPRRACTQDRLYVALCAIAFAVSLLVVAGILPAGRGSEGVVIAALTGCIVVLAARAWRRNDGLPAYRQGPVGRGEGRSRVGAP